MSADKCPVCGALAVHPNALHYGYLCAKSEHNPCGNAERLAIERGSEVERLTAKLAKWESELSKVMPPDFKDWWQNSRDEWPEIARWVIQAGRAQQAVAWEQVEALTSKLEDAEKNIQKPA